MKLITIFLITLQAFSWGDAIKIKPYKKPKPIVWIVGVDITYDKCGSPPPEHFNTYPEIVKKYVLYHAMERDEIHILLIDTNPIDEIKKYPINGNRLKVADIARDIYEYAKSIRQLPRNKGYTNIGGFLKYARNISQIRRGERIVAISITDGKPTGEQDIKGGPTTGEMKVLFVGVDKEESESDLIRLGERIGLKSNQMKIITYPYWDEEVGSFEKEIGRRKNSSIINHLEGKKILF